MAATSNSLQTHATDVHRGFVTPWDLQWCLGIPSSEAGVLRDTICRAAEMGCVIKGHDMYLEAQKQIVGRIMLRVCFWKADLETIEKSNGGGQ